MLAFHDFVGSTKAIWNSRPGYLWLFFTAWIMLSVAIHTINQLNVFLVVKFQSVLENAITPL